MTVDANNYLFCYTSQYYNTTINNTKQVNNTVMSFGYIWTISEMRNLFLMIYSTF